MCLTLHRSAGIGVAFIMWPSTNVLVYIAASTVAIAVCRAETPACDENGLWQIWVNHTNAVADHAVIAGDCRAFRTKTPTDPLTVVAQGLEIWHLLKAGKTNEAAQLLEPMAALSGDALPKAGAEMARGWLTRLDRELVRTALMRVYVSNVEFPVSLEAIKTLNATTLPPFADRWNQPWSYRSSDLPTIKGSPRQHYILESSRLGANSDLAQSLAVPYASRITVAPVRVMGGVDTGEIVEFTSPTRKSGALTVGAEIDGITFAFMGRSIIVLSDGDHWRIVVRPH